MKRTELIATITRRFPFYSGRGQIANHPWFRSLTGTSPELAWCPVPGGEALVSLSDYVGRAAFYFGDLDRKISWVLSQVVRPGDTVLDVGANIGLVTLLLSKLVGTEGRVLAFEPSPLNVDLLEQTLARNGAGNVRVFSSALSDTRSEALLRVPRGNSGAGSLIRHQETEHESLLVQTDTLSRVAANEDLGNIRLLKLDVEGYEAEVLEGARDVFEACPPFAVLFEISRPGARPLAEEPSFVFLRRYGYRFYALPPRFFRPLLVPLAADDQKRVTNDVLASLTPL